MKKEGRRRVKRKGRIEQELRTALICHCEGAQRPKSRFAGILVPFHRTERDNLSFLPVPRQKRDCLPASQNHIGRRASFHWIVAKTSLAMTGRAPLPRMFATT